MHQAEFQKDCPMSKPRTGSGALATGGLGDHVREPGHNDGKAGHHGGLHIAVIGSGGAAMAATLKAVE